MSLEISLDAHISGVHVTPDAISACTLEGYVYILRPPPRDTGAALSSELIATAVVPKREGISASAEYDGCLLLGDTSGCLHLLKPLHEHGEAMRSMSITDPNAEEAITHITTGLGGELSAVSDSAGHVRIYSTREMSYVTNLPIKAFGGVVPLGEHNLLATGVERTGALVLFDVRNTKKAVDIIELGAEDIVSSVCDPVDGTYALGTTGGRCFLFRETDAVPTATRCFVASDGDVRNPITSVRVQGGHVLCGDAGGTVTALDLSARVRFREHSTTTDCNSVQGLQKYTDNIILCARNTTHSSVVRFINF
eukprot:PhM_4_TR7017/c0_g1_i1/m.35564